MMMRIKDAEQAQSVAELNRKIAELEIQVKLQSQESEVCGQLICH